MKRYVVGLVSGLLAIGIISAVGAAGLTPEEPAGTAATGRVRDSYVVVLEDGATADRVAADHGLNPAYQYRRVFTGFAATIPPGKLKAVQQDERVSQVRPNYLVRTPEYSAKGKPGAGGSGQSVPLTVQRVGAAPGAVSYTGSGVAIAIIDTGVDLGNADLTVSTACFDAFGGTCQDGNGHGTHVAGIAAAKNNSRDVVGVAPNAVIVPVRVLDNNGSGSDASVIAGIDWVAGNAAGLGIKVANASLGREASSDDSAMQLAVQGLVNAGVVFVAAAGNDPGVDTAAQVPSGLAEAIAVGSTAAVDGSNACRSYGGVIKADTASYFTSDGTKVLVSAPGEERENIAKSCFIQSVGALSLKPGGGTTRMSGTSMASPLVAGVAALLLEQDPSATVACITAKLSAADREGVAPLNSPTSSYSYDGEREGVSLAAKALAASC